MHIILFNETAGFMCAQLGWMLQIILNTRPVSTLAGRRGCHFTTICHWKVALDIDWQIPGLKAEFLRLVVFFCPLKLKVMPQSSWQLHILLNWFYINYLSHYLSDIHRSSLPFPLLTYSDFLSDQITWWLINTYL